MRSPLKSNIYKSSTVYSILFKNITSGFKVKITRKNKQKKWAIQPPFADPPHNAVMENNIVQINVGYFINKFHSFAALKTFTSLHRWLVKSYCAFK